MGAIGGLLGLGGGASGTGFNVTPTVTPEQLQAAYSGAQQGISSQQALLNALQAQQGLQKQGDIYGQLQQVVSGQGPNPAQAMLAQATGQNVANQAALMAGQRGAGANVGLMARQAANVGSKAQQDAASQAALMQAQQSLGALGQAGSLANQMAAQQIQGTGALTQAQLEQQKAMQQAQQAYNQQQAGLTSQQMQGQQGLIGGVLGGAGTALGLAEGGEVPDDSEQSMFGKYMANMGSAANSGPKALNEGMQSFIGGLKEKFTPAPVAPIVPTAAQFPITPMGKASLAPMETRAKGGDVGSKLKKGGHVPGKASVRGDSEANDTVHAMLSPGEIVIPRSVINSADPARGAAEFVQAVLAKKGIRS
jgi:hypothetical protein